MLEIYYNSIAVTTFQLSLTFRQDVANLIPAIAAPFTLLSGGITLEAVLAAFKVEHQALGTVPVRDIIHVPSTALSTPSIVAAIR